MPRSTKDADGNPIKRTRTVKPVRLLLGITLTNGNGETVDTSGYKVHVDVTRDMSELVDALVRGEQPKGLMAVVEVPKS